MEIAQSEKNFDEIRNDFCLPALLSTGSPGRDALKALCRCASARGA